MRCVVISIVLMLLSLPGQAALGRTPQAGGAANAMACGQPMPMAVAQSCAVFTVSLPTATVVREFVDATGRVFALSWSGPLQPDLAAFLGEYFADYQNTVQQRRAAGQRGGVLHVRTDRLVLLSRGRMGQFEGHAYLPTRVPPDVDIQAWMP